MTPAHGSIAAHDALVRSFVDWRLKQQACEALPMDAVEAALADLAWMALKDHAINCGWSADTHGPLSAWAPRRVRSYGKSIGVSPLEIAIVVGLEDPSARLSPNLQAAE